MIYLRGSRYDSSGNLVKLQVIDLCFVMLNSCCTGGEGMSE